MCSVTKNSPSAKTRHRVAKLDAHKRDPKVIFVTSTKLKTGRRLALALSQDKQT